MNWFLFVPLAIAATTLPTFATNSRAEAAEPRSARAKPIQPAAPAQPAGNQLRLSPSAPTPMTLANAAYL